MTFTYPVVLMPRKNDKDYHVIFPGLQCYEADGPDLEGAVEYAREAVYNWLYPEIEERTFELPSQTHVEDIKLERGEFLEQIMVIVKLLSDNG